MIREPETVRRIGRVATLGVLLLAVASRAPGQDEAPRDAAVVPARGGGPLQVEDLAPPDELVEVGGITTHYEARGDRGPAIVLIHGFGSNTTTWRPTLQGLGDRFRLYALDLKGFGLTEKPRDGQYHVGAFAEHLLGFLDAMGLERPVLVGNSMGGAVALHLALTHPGRVRGLVLVDAAMPDFRPPRLDLGDGDRRILERQPGDGRFDAPTATPGGLPIRPNPVLLRLLITRSMVERGLRASYHDPTRVTPEMVEAYYLPTTVDGAMEALADMMAPPPAAKAAIEGLPPLESLEMPVLVVWGRHDRVLPVAMAEDFVRRIPGARRLILEESGHLPHEEQPGAFNAALAEFVDTIE